MYQKGYKHSEETKAKIRQGRIAENNPNWKGNKVGKNQLHVWIRTRKPKPEFCEQCKMNKPIDLANISQKYKRDVNDFKWLCRRCHMLEDGRMKKFISIQRPKGKKSKNWKGGKPKCLICGKMTSTYKSKWCRKHSQIYRKVLPTLCLICKTKINYRSKLCMECRGKNRNLDGTFKKNILAGVPIE